MSPSGLEPSPAAGHPLLSVRCPACGHQLRPPIAWPARRLQAQLAEPGAVLNPDTIAAEISPQRGGDRRLATTVVIGSDRLQLPER